jgi:membrane protein YqaA with SNARE-associated domain
MFLKALTVAGLATFELYAAIPAGFAFHLSPWMIFFASAFGGIVGVFVVAFLGNKIGTFLRRRKSAKKNVVKKHPLLRKFWSKYGTIGLGFLGSISVGPPISLTVGIALNANIKKLIIWCCIGVITRCIVFTLLGAYGLKLF